MTIVDRQQRLLLKKFHTLCGKAGVSQEEKRAMVESYGHISSKELTVPELVSLCNSLEAMMRPDLVELDKYRKRLLASIFAWREAMSDKSTMGEVKAIACRAAKAEKFNDIPLERLRSLYNAFNKKTKDLAMVEDLTTEEMNYKAWVN